MPIDLKKYNFLNNTHVERPILLENQGYCNNNYLLKTPNQNYLIREFKLLNNRKSEFNIQKKAYRKGVAAKPILLDEVEGLMICEFIEGIHKTKLKPYLLKRVALQLKKLHGIKHHKKIPPLKKNFKVKEKRVYEAFNILKKFQQEYVLGHNDLHPKNILFGKTIQFIDWEYAGVTDKYFDLAAIIIEFKLSRRDEEIFLRSYFSRDSKVNPKKLKAFKTIYKTLWRVWFEKLECGQIKVG